MALAVFNQFPQLTRFFSQLARAVTQKETARRLDLRLDVADEAGTIFLTCHTLAPVA